MAIAATTNWSWIATATGSNVNGGGFNYNNAGMLTDAAATSATGNAPVITSASYNFVAGDVNAWIYIKAGTNWTPGFYKITSVATNAATVDATIGAAVQLSATTAMWGANTVAGVATTASPTGGTFSVDYSQQTTAKIAAVADFNAVGASTTLTSATAGFTPVMVGNIFHQTTTGTGAFGIVGWYEIATYVNATTVTLDRTPNTGTASVNTTGYVGGAMSMGALDDPFMEAGAAGNMHFIKNGTYSPAAAVSISLAGTRALPIWMIGFNTIRGDNPAGSSRPIINMGANAWTNGSNFNAINVIFTGTAASMYTPGGNFRGFNCKFANTSTTTTRIASGIGGGMLVEGCEYISYRGYGLSGTGALTVKACYFHDSDVGLRRTNTDSSTIFVQDSIFVSNITNAWSNTGTSTGALCFFGNTFYGSEDKLGVGLDFTTSTFVYFANNIVYGFTTGLTRTSLQAADYLDYNNFFNNTTPVTNFNLGVHGKALNPTFTGVAQLTGSTATTSGSVLTQSGAFSGITVGQDYLYIVSGTGITVGVYGITAFDANTVTLDIAPGTSATADKVWKITTGRNFAIGTNLKALGFPGAFTGTATTGYTDIGGVQRQESGSGGVAKFAGDGGGFVG